MLGEVALFLGIIMMVASSQAMLPLGHVLAGRVPAALMIIGFAIKAGLLPLHMWLPLAHLVAPVAASAVLSGVMIKAGLLGMMRLLALGMAVLAIWGEILMVLGLAGLACSIVVGLT